MPDRPAVGAVQAGLPPSRMVVRCWGAFAQWVAVLPGPAKGTQPCCRRVVRSFAIAPAVDTVHRVWPMIRERSIGEYPRYPVALAVSGCVMNPVSVLPGLSIRSTRAPDSGASGD